jgi:hypothetical protein
MRASYKHAIYWIAANDDTCWVDNKEPISVTATLVADLFGKTDQQVIQDLTRELRRQKERKTWKTIEN